MPGQYVYNDSHDDFSQRWKTPSPAKGQKGVPTEVVIPSDGVAWCSEAEMAWMLPKFTFLKVVTKAEAEACCKRRGRVLPTSGSGRSTRTTTANPAGDRTS